jgi:sugar phosphate isomerase/epimerase
MPNASNMPVGELKDLSAADLKQKLEEAGVTVTFVGREQRNGVDSDHLLLNVDLKKLEASDLAKELPADKLSGLSGAAASGTLTADVWLDASTGRPNEVAIHAADGSDKADITVLISDPGDVSLDAPASFVEVPIAPLLAPLLQQFGGALGSPAP